VKRVLFDQGVPMPLGRMLVGMEITTAFRQGWSQLSNGDLLNAAEASGFEVLMTTDQNLRYQQNLANRRIAILVLPTTQWVAVQSHVAEIQAALDACRSGDYIEVRW
jgi:hypothetical protein